MVQMVRLLWEFRLWVALEGTNPLFRLLGMVHLLEVLARHYDWLHAYLSNVFIVLQHGALILNGKVWALRCIEIASRMHCIHLYFVKEVGIC